MIERILFEFKDDWTSLFKMISDEDAGRLIKAMIDTAHGVEPDDFDNVYLDAMLSMISVDIEVED